MDTTTRGWRIIDRDTCTLMHEYFFSKPDGLANTFVTAMAPGQLMVVSPAVRVEPELLDDLAQFGEVRALVASNGFHHLGIRQWRDHFPKAKCYAPAQALARIAKKGHDVGPLRALSKLSINAESGVFITEVPETKCGEIWVRRATQSGQVWFVSDILANIERLPKNFIFKMIFKLSKSAPGYKVFHLGLKFIVGDGRKVLRDLLEDMTAHPPTVVVPAHGQVLDHAELWPDTKAMLQAHC